MVSVKVIQRTIGPDGQVTGTYDNNPFLNSIIYDLEFEHHINGSHSGSLKR